VKHQIKILREVYFDTLKYADAQGYPSNLRGLCSIAAYELSRRLRRAGFKADFTIGTYTGVPHCWVVTKTEIFDAARSRGPLLRRRVLRGQGRPNSRLGVERQSATAHDVEKRHFQCGGEICHMCLT
jgi:hypothetical protein